MGFAAVVLRGVPRRMRLGSRELSYKGQHKSKASAPSADTPSAAPAADTPAPPLAPSAATGAPAAARGSSSPQPPSKNHGGGSVLPLLGFGAMVAGGAAAYYYYNTTQEPQPLPATPTPELKLKEEPPKLNEEAQEAAPIGAGFQDLGGAPAEACGSQSGLGSDASEHQEEEDVESSESTSAAEATEEEPGPAKQKMEDEEADADVEEMRVASEELRMQAEVVTGLLNEVLAGGTGLLQAAAEGEDQLPAVKEDEEESDASQSEAVVVLKAQIQEEKERLAEAEARLEEAKVAADELRQTMQQQKEEEIKQIKEYMAFTAAQALETERAKRVLALDSVRNQVNVFGQALRQKQEDVQSSAATHRLALAAFALQQALDDGRPIVRELMELKESAGGDDLVNAAADSLAEAASVGVPTRVQLINRFDKVVSSAGKLVLMPEGCGGIVATALSAIAASLRIPEAESQRVGLEGGGLTAASARARAKLASGELMAAAKELETATCGSAASAIVADWAAAARARAIADQAMLMIQAHAMTVAASLAS